MITNPPLRLKVLNALSDLIRTVTPANGFQSDLSSPDCVVRGRLTIGDSDPTPLVAFNEPPMSIERVKASPQNPNAAGEWDILIQGWTDPEEDEDPTDRAYLLAAEVGQVLASEKRKPSGRPGYGRGPDFLGFGPIITDMRIGAPVVRPPDVTSAMACFYIVLTLQIVEDMTRPFG